MYRAYYYVTHLLYKPTFFSISLRIMSPKPPPTHPTLEINQPKQQQQHLHLILCAAFFDIQSYHRFCNDMLLYIINLTKKTNKYQMGSCSLKNYADQIYTMITMRIMLAFFLWCLYLFKWVKFHYKVARKKVAFCQKAQNELTQIKPIFLTD